MLQAVQTILGAGTSASYVQYTSSVVTIVMVVIIGRAICRIFDI